MLSLDLSENMRLVVWDTAIEIHEARPLHAVHDAALLFRQRKDAAGVVHSHGLLGLIRAGRRDAGGAVQEVARVALEERSPFYGHTAAEGVAEYADGSKEDWQIRVDTERMRVDWVRQPHDPAGALCFRILLPRPDGTLTLWHTGGGRQLSSVGLAPSETLPDETEALAYSVHPKNGFRFELETGGSLAAAPGIRARAAYPGELPGEAGGEIGETVWEALWCAHPAALIHFAFNAGIRAAAREFNGAAPLRPADASYDFGSFYWQVYLGGLPLNQRPGPEGAPGVRARVLGGAAPESADGGACSAEPSLREIAWASEFLYLVTPGGATGLLRRTLQQHLPAGRHEDPLWPAGLTGEDAALLLMMAGRLHALTEDAGFARAHLDVWRACARRLLQMRLPGEALPITDATWEAQGRIVGKEPYFTALCHSALTRLAFIEDTAGERVRARDWRIQAEILREGAMAAVEQGGLWDAAASRFVNFIDYKDAPRRAPRPCDWAPGEPGVQGHPRRELALYQNVVPFWLGLVHEPALIRRAYEHIDLECGYASGRPGADWPPHLHETYIAILDICVRLRNGVPGAEVLLQRLHAHAFDLGMPLPAAPFGLPSAGPPNLVPADDGPLAPMAGRLVDNSAYLGMLIHVHYGLDYGQQGWYIGDPAPLPGFPLTRIGELRHGHARYAITYQGRGRVKRVTLNGKAHRGAWLGANEGVHEVVVYLG